MFCVSVVLCVPPRGSDPVFGRCSGFLGLWSGRQRQSSKLALPVFYGEYMARKRLRKELAMVIRLRRHKDTQLYLGRIRTYLGETRWYIK